MNKKKKKRISALILLLAITVGYALLSTTLKINGIAGIKSNTWDIHFENVVANNESTVTAELPSITDNATKVSYEVELSLPGDFYEFTVDAVNEGSINGIIEKIDHKVYESDGITEATLPSYIKYSIVYDGTSTAPQEGDILEAGESKTYRVRIEFDSEATTLPSTDLTYVIVDEIKYTQTKEKADKSVEEIIDEIEVDPDSHRNPDQDSTNRDIGIDEDGNIVNLDWWVDKKNCTGEKIYYLNDEKDGMILGKAMCGFDGTSFDEHYTAATSEANIENGEWKLKIPSYIYDDTTSQIYPVVEIAYLFGNATFGWDNREPEKKLTKMPKIPDTITIIGAGIFNGLRSLDSITIPKNIKIIRQSAFASAFKLNESNNQIIFEDGSQLERIDDEDTGMGAFEYNGLTSITLPQSVTYIGSSAFNNNSLTGNLVLPQSVTYIGKGAFHYNNLTSVTFPSTATYFENEKFSWDNSFATYSLSALSLYCNLAISDSIAFKRCLALIYSSLSVDVTWFSTSLTKEAFSSS